MEGDRVDDRVNHQKHDQQADGLGVKNAQRGRDDRHQRVHRRMLHHRRCRTFGAHDLLNRLDMCEIGKNARQQIEYEIATDCRGARTDQAEHEVKGRDEQHRLKHAEHDRPNCVAMALAHFAGCRDKAELKHVHRKTEGRLRAPCLEHKRLTPDYPNNVAGMFPCAPHLPRRLMPTITR